MKNLEFLAMGIIAGVVATAICLNENKKPCKKQLPKEECVPICDLPQKPKCKKCFYQKYYR